jgi:hypothetical protein
MYPIAIGPRLWFEETMLGATLNYCSSETSDATLFQVGLSTQSLSECDKALGGPSCLWRIRDGSFSFYGDAEEIRLSFASLGGPCIQAQVSLYGAELEAFRAVVNALAFRQRINLN